MRIKELRESRNVQQKVLASILGIPSNTLSQYENGKREPNKEIVLQIAEYFNVSTDFIYGRENLVTCKDCGLSYNPLTPLDINVHNDYHERWQKAVSKFGKLYSNTGENEKIKAENRNIVNDRTLPLEDRISAQLEVYRCLFSRSLSTCNYDERHVGFNEYVSMMLNNEELKNEFGEDLYSALVDKFGTSLGIPSGESYYNPNNSSLALFSTDTLAAHFDAQEFTDDELEEIMNFVEFVKNKRN